MVTCAWVLEHAEDCVDGPDGGLSPVERDALSRHLAACEDCRGEIAAAHAVLAGLRALPTFDCPPGVIEAAERSIGATGRARPVLRDPRAWLRWGPAAVAAAALVALVATARWAPPPAVDTPAAEAGVEQAARETMLAFSYVDRYVRRTGEIVATDVIQKRVVGTVERTLDRDLIERGVAPSLRRAMGKSGIVETIPPRERS